MKGIATARQLEFQQPFDLNLCLTMGQAFRWVRLEDGWFSGVLGENLFHIRQIDSVIEYRVSGPHGEREPTCADDRLLSRYFRDDDDVGAIYAGISRDPVVANLVRQYPGMRVLRQDPWECLVSYILSQTASIGAIQTNVDKIAQRYGQPLRLDQDERHTFPTARKIVEEGLSAFNELHLGLDKADHIFSCAESVCAGLLNLEPLALPNISSSIATKKLDDFPGIGPKIANCVALMSLDKLDAFPVDRWVLRALEEAQLAGCPLPRKNPKGQYQMHDSAHRRLADWAQGHFGRYAGCAGQYLFHAIEPNKQKDSGRTS